METSTGHYYSSLSGLSRSLSPVNFAEEQGTFISASEIRSRKYIFIVEMTLGFLFILSLLV